MTKPEQLLPTLFLALVLAVRSIAVEAADGAGSGFFSGEAAHGVITDAQTGEPIEGAVIVARWGSLAYQYRLAGSGYVRGEPLHVDEAVSGPKGRYATRGWRREHPIGVRPDDRTDPLLAVFKSGYEPLLVRNEAGKDRAGGDPGDRRPSDWNVRTIRLKRWSGSVREYATLLASFQFGGLDWMGKDAWKAMPRMVLALHQEKRRLGNDGAAIEGVDRMPGRAGAGTLVDIGTGKPVLVLAPYLPIISIAWTLRQIDGSATRRYVQQQTTWGSFSVSPWRIPSPPLPPGWDFAFDAPPVVTAYAPGYHRVAGILWPDAGMVMSLSRIAPERDAQLAELRAWREDLETELRAVADRNEAITSLGELILRLADECRTLVPDAREGICFDPDSDLVQDAMHSLRASQVVAPRPQEMRGTFGVAGASQTVPSPPVGAPFGSSGPLVPPISIEPVAPEGRKPRP